MQKVIPFGRRTPAPDSPCRMITPRPDGAALALRERRIAAREAHWCISYIHSFEADGETPREVREVILLDISDSGARFRSRSRAAFSERVLVKVARLGIHRTGHVIWQKGFDAGIAFDRRPLSI
ncbi:MAG: PilZ domain-containing protein [Henriciella sp.]